MKNPILIDIPNQFESRRLILRTPREGDSRIVFPAIEETRETLRRWIPWSPPAKTMEEAEEDLREAIASVQMRRSIRFLVFNQENGEFIGQALFHSFNWKIPRCEIGYWVRASKQNQGYMTEAVERMTSFGFEVLKMARIDIHCDTENIASYRVAEKAGYVREGVLRNHRRNIKRELADTVVYAVIPDDWTKRGQGN